MLRLLMAIGFIPLIVYVIYSYRKIIKDLEGLVDDIH